MIDSPTAAWDFRRSATSVQLLLQLGIDHGVSAQRCLAGTGLGAAALADPAAEVEAQQELQLIRNLQREAGHVAGLGLEAGLRYHLTTYGIWGFALISSPTFRDAANVGLRYLDLTYAFNRISAVEEGPEFRLLIDDRTVPEDVRQFLVERDAAAIRLMQQELYAGGLPLRRVEFRFPRPAYAARFEEVFGLMPQFGQPQNLAALDLAAVGRPLPLANERTARMCEAQCRELLARRKARAGVAAQVRDRLLRTPGRMPDMEQLAAELCMTSRTLRRKLEGEGASYRGLAEEVRETLAEELLATAQLTVEGIAERLGYSEPSSFIHAFKRWKGVAPTAYRRE